MGARDPVRSLRRKCYKGQPVRLHRPMIVLVAMMLLASIAPARANARTYGFVEFPKDEHQHIDGWDYWWGAADLATRSGNRYTVGIAFDSFDGYGATGHQVFPRQGPYKGRSIMTMDGPTEWGHPGEATGRFVRKMSVYVPGQSELLDYDTLDTSNGLKNIGEWTRTTLKRERYHLRIDNDEAKVHPSARTVKVVVDLIAEMRSPPLLLGGTGQWWYGLPQAFHYPSRSFQYMQAAKRLTGTLALQQPDGKVLRENIVSTKSKLVMVHEYDATPEDLFGGLALAESTQIHPRYAPYYSGGMPWDLIFVDLTNGAQLMVAVLAFHDTKNGTVTPVIGTDMPTYKAMATLRLPSGESIPLDKKVKIQHLNHRVLIGKVPTFQVQVDGIWVQDWAYRVGYAGGKVKAPNGKTVRVPPFDIGLVPQFAQSEPAIDSQGNGLTQRVPFLAAGSYGACPVRGFGWSELIINWYRHNDPWFTGGSLPRVPSRCEKEEIAPRLKKTGNLDPAPDPMPPPNFSPEGCAAYSPGAPRCVYKATIAGGLGGYGAQPGGWTVTITRKSGRRYVIHSHGGQETYACGTIQPGDRVEAQATDGSGVLPGNPGICF
jgi:hypothetical protein